MEARGGCGSGTGGLLVKHPRVSRGGGLTAGVSGIAVVARTSLMSESSLRAPGILLSSSSDIKNPRSETNFLCLHFQYQVQLQQL